METQLREELVKTDFLRREAERKAKALQRKLDYFTLPRVPRRPERPAGTTANSLEDVDMAPPESGTGGVASAVVTAEEKPSVDPVADEQPSSASVASVVRQPERHVGPTDEQTKQRNRRMLGMLMGTLRSFSKEADKAAATIAKRREIEDTVTSKAAQEEEERRQADIRNVREELERTRADIETLTHDLEDRETKFLEAKAASHKAAIDKFKVTVAEPHLRWAPKDLIERLGEEARREREQEKLSRMRRARAESSESGNSDSDGGEATNGSDSEGARLRRKRRRKRLVDASAAAAAASVPVEQKAEPQASTDTAMPDAKVDAEPKPAGEVPSNTATGATTGEEPKTKEAAEEGQDKHAVEAPGEVDEDLKGKVEAEAAKEPATS